MGGSVVSAGPGEAKVKKDTFRDSLEQFHERCSSLLYLSLQWKDLDDHYNAVDEALDRKSEELRLREGSLREIYRDVEAKQEEFRILEDMIEDRCKELNSQADDFCEKYLLAIEEKGREIEREIERRLEKIAAKEKCFDSQSLLVQRFINERFKEVEGKEKQLARREKEVGRQSKLLAEKSQGLEVERANLNERLSEVKLREDQIKERLREYELEFLQFELDRERLMGKLKEVESKDRQAEERLRDLDSKSKELEVRSRELESEKERFRLDVGNFNEQLQAVDLKEKQVEERAEELDLKNKKLEVRLKELESDRRLFNADRGKLDEWLRELESDKSKSKSDRNKLDGLLGEVELKDKQTNERAKDLELKKKQLEVRWEELEVNRIMFEANRCKLNELLTELESNKRVFDSDREKLDERLRELDLKATQLEGQRKELESSRKGFEEQVENFKLMENKFEERTKDVELKSKQWEEKFHRIQNLKVRGCLIVDGKILQVLLNECRKDHEKIGDEVLFLLKISQDPAKVVLDAMQGFFPPHLKHGDVEFKGSTVRASCILLLEQLMKISPDIKQEVKSEATKLSFDWMTKLRPDREHSPHILGFLLLVANFKLRRAFDGNELLNYAKVIAHWRPVPELCRVLGFRDEIPGFIQDLLARKEHLNAIRFASMFDLLSEFPPDPIMKEFMEMSRSAFKSIYDNENSSLEAQSQATNKRIGDLKSAIRCIEDHKLKLGYCPANIRQAIASLEKQLADRRKAAAVVGDGVKLQGVHDENDMVHGSPRISPAPSSMPLSANCSVAERAAAIASLDTPLQQKQNMKHSQPDISQQAVPSTPADSDNCFQSLVLESDQQVCLRTHQDHLPRGNVIEDVRSTSPKAGHNELLNSSVDMDGEGLRSLFRGNVEDKLVKNNVAILLKSSSKPADLVFYVIQGLHSSISGKDGSSSELGILVKGSILLLKELKSFSFILDPQLHARATKFSRIYKSSLKAAKNNYMGVICLLQFLDVYKVPHNADEVISLLDPSIWCKEVPHSCKLLGLQDLFLISSKA